MTAVIVIVVLQNDSPLTIRTNGDVLSFAEGDVALAVGTVSAAVLVDEDRDAMIQNLTLSLVGALEDSREFIVINTLAIYPENGGLQTGTEITLTLPGTIGNYQVS